MKKAILTGLVLVLMLFLFSSCGVSSEEYAKVSADLAVAQNEIETLQSDLSGKESEFETVQGQLEITAGKLETAQNQLETVTEKLEEGKARMELINGVWVPIMKGESPGGVSYFFEWRDQITAIEDPILTQRFNDMIDKETDEAFQEFFVYLFESAAGVLE